TEVGSGAPLLGRYKPKQERHGIAVQVEEHETAAVADILRAQMTEKVGFALPRLTQDGQVFTPFGVQQIGAGMLDFPVDQPESEIQPCAGLRLPVAGGN